MLFGKLFAFAALHLASAETKEVSTPPLGVTPAFHSPRVEVALVANQKHHHVGVPI